MAHPPRPATACLGQADGRLTTRGRPRPQGRTIPITVARAILDETGYRNPLFQYGRARPVSRPVLWAIKQGTKELDERGLSNFVSDLKKMVEAKERVEQEETAKPKL
jgi:hypothetical protein